MRPEHTTESRIYFNIFGINAILTEHPVSGKFCYIYKPLLNMNCISSFSERVAGLSPEKLVEAHGTFHSSHCRKCNKV